MPPDVFADFGNPSVAGMLSSVQSSGFQRPRPVPNYLFSEITTAELAGNPVIEFQVTDEFGLGIEGFDQGENVNFSFTVSKLFLGANGKTNNWATYILVPRAPDGLPAFAPATYSDGTLEDLGGGNYRFTFDQTLEQIAGVEFEADLTHRVGVEIRGASAFGGSISNNNTFDSAFDIQPSTGATSGITQRRITTQESCATCHGTEDFAFHGGARKDVSRCVTCHQTGLESVTGDSIDFTVMVHKIHFGENLSQPFELCGFACRSFGAPPVSFNEIAYPQDTRNCTTCHDPQNPETPEADWVDNRATAQVCASCHDDLAFNENGLTNANHRHIGLAQPNSTCEACHSTGGLLQGNLDYHIIDSQVAAQRFSYNILDISSTDEGQSPIITFSITDPTDDDRPYDITTDPAFTGDGTSLRLGIAWPNSDFTNVSNNAGTEILGRPTANPASITLAPNGGVLPEGVIDNGDGTYTLDMLALSSPIVVPSTNPPLGSGTVTIEGHPAADFNFDGSYDDSVPATSAAMAFAITDPDVQARRMVVDVAKCQDCHGVNDGLSLHGGNRTDNPLVCSTCHNPNMTDLFRRPIDPDEMLNGENLATVDGLEDNTVDFKYMVHAIHGSSKRETAYVAYGFGGTAHNYGDASYPRSPADCLACHVDGSFTLPIADGVQATTLSANATVTAGSRFGATGYAPDNASASDPTDDNNVSRTAAVCLSCHDSAVAVTHMSVRSDSGFSFGNGWLMNPDPFNDPDTQAFIDSAPAENCVFCHSESGFVPVGEVHGIRN